MIRYLTTTHLTGTRPTSDGSRGAMPGSRPIGPQMLGRGAWWVWDDLPDDVRRQVRRVVAHEADRIAKTEPPHRIQPTPRPRKTPGTPKSSPWPCF